MQTRIDSAARGNGNVTSLVQAAADTDTQLADLRIIEQSHQRCLGYGIARHQNPDLDLLSAAELALALERNQALFGHARPVMETLYDQIRNTHNMVILADAEGTIIHTLGDKDFLVKADQVALGPGVHWSEQRRGTNAIGTALHEQKPTTVHAQEHYLNANHFLTCSSAPIFDHQGRVLGVLDVSGECGSYHKHTMALVRMSAQMIENHLFTSNFADCITLHFHSRPEFVGTLVEGIVSFTPGGRFLSANRSAQFQLGLSLAALQSHTFSSLFGMPVSMLFDHHQKAMPELMDLYLHSGVRIHARAELKLKEQHFQQARVAAAESQLSAPPTVRTPAQHGNAVSAQIGQGLAALDTGDARLHDIIAKLRKVLTRDIPIMIAGETGAGKEWLARAIHQDSSRNRAAAASGHAAPFVALNCSAIPESLIEAELFGYEEGAFTGARKKGGTGKILQAQGGTLFLDEIGDMPLSLQGRLLRVLQERAVTPLGSNRQLRVEFTLVCATNQPLREMVAQHRFREDLYYRLNGLQVKLPALRMRSDLAQLAQQMLAQECRDDAGAKQFDAQVQQLLLAYHWPGNLRQLANLVRTAVAMAGDESFIKAAHLPEDFLEDLGMAEPVYADAYLADEDAAHDATAVASTGMAATSMQQTELAAIRRALHAHQGNVTAAARTLGISRNTIYRRLKSSAR
ncbi:sigma-54-dependent Fis family transcriptional regulator [Herbaspirillum lusitanum]|uniref:Sigma-54-dependent Fis family transcriptional regulator n=1 Tax=Herbaspirillum lusitanum TaxID=213312 RepID=A0ABW9A4Z6_9BURK